MKTAKIRKEIRKKYFSSSGMIIVTFLGIMGFLMVYFPWKEIMDTEPSIYDGISKHGIMIIFGSFFFLVTLYCWILYFLNVILPPKKETLYLLKKEDEKYFINRKGKRIDYYSSKKELTPNCYYSVLKTHNYVYKILDKTIEEWIPIEKKSYWLNYYSPIGNFENIFLLPIIYVILLPGLLSFIMSKGLFKIFGLLFMSVPLYLVIYDLIYKIKIRQAGCEEIDETNFIKSTQILKNIIEKLYQNLQIIIISIVLSLFIVIIIFFVMTSMNFGS